MSAVIEDAERVLINVMNRWKNEIPAKDIDPAEPACHFIGGDDVGHCLLAFRIDGVERVPVELHDAPKPISDYFKAQLTLTLTPRPNERMSLESMRGKAVNPNIEARTYHVKRFIDGTWLVLCDSVA